ncbi:MAG: CpXC domain-containing protein [Bacteroidales bacterium]|nr:CpXC domain-containing protein [Bacteroidales bacterium]
MASISSVTVNCSKCSGSHEVSIYNSINVAQDPELKESVKTGAIFIWECPHCGSINLIKYPCLYHDPDTKFMVWLLPEGSISEDKVALLSSQLEGLDGYTLRRVTDVGNLIEKVNILDSNLDDRIIEMCKYVTKLELAEKLGKNKASMIFEAPFKFYKMAGPDNDIFFSYPCDGKMEGVNIGFNVYEDCRGIVSRNQETTAVKGFATVDQDWISSIMR